MSTFVSCNQTVLIEFEHQRKSNVKGRWKISFEESQQLFTFGIGNVYRLHYINYRVGFN